MRKRHIILPVIVGLAIISTAVIQTNQAPQIEGLIGEVRIQKSSVAPYPLGSEDDRTRLRPKEPVALSLKINREKDRKGKLRIVAPNGGQLNRQNKHLETDLPGEGKTLDFEFMPGDGPGRYTVEVSHGDATKTLEFWVGDEPPVGKPGPNLNFAGTR